MLIGFSLLELDDLLACLWLHPVTDPPHDEWSAVVQRIVEAKSRTRTPNERLRNLVISDGGAPDAAERKELFERVWGQQSGKIAVVTTVLSNPVKRGIATALAWMNPQFGFFRPEQAPEAMAHVGLTDYTLKILGEYQRLEAAMGPSPALQAARKAIRGRP